MAVYKRSYRGYAGPLTPTWSRFAILPRYAYRDLFQSKIMTADACAARIAKAIDKREREVLMSARGRLGRWLKLIAPSLIDRIAAKAIRDRH